jgi:hypothetical protein
MLARFMEVIRADLSTNNEKLESFQESVRADFSANNKKLESFQESVRTDINSVKTDISTNNDKLESFQESVRADIGSVKADISNVSAEISSVKADLTTKLNQLQEANLKFQVDLRAETKAESEKLIKRIDQQNMQAKKELSAKLDTEARRLTNLVGQVQKETELELVAVRNQLQSVSSVFETKLEQNGTRTQDSVNELADQLVDHRAEVESNINKLDNDVNSRLSRQKESIEREVTQDRSATERKFELVNAKIVALETKISGAPVAAESRATFSPSVVNQNNHSGEIDGAASSQVTTDGNNACSCQSTSTCRECVRVNASNVGMPVQQESVAVSSFLSNSELPLPQFDDSSDTNPVFHLRRLDEFMRLRSVPKAFQLAVAYRSIVGQMSKQWVETVSRNLPDYDTFKRAFLEAWWSNSRQSLVRCSLYQAKYNRSSNLSLSGHFLKYATMASYLEPRPTDVEVIEAIRYHFPLGVQRAMLSNNLSTIEGTLDLLKRVEVMEACEGFQRPHNQPQTPQHNTTRPHPNSPRDDRRTQNQNHVRQVQYSRPRNRNWNRRNQYGREEEREPRDVGSNPLNPNAPTFQRRPESVQSSSANNNTRSEN